MALDLSADGKNVRPDLILPVTALSSVRRGLDWRRLAVIALALVALVPVGLVLARTADVRSHLVYWDEFDTALAFLLKLKAGATPGAFLHELFGVSNEHRMVTSRLIFAASYWTTGTIDFALIDVIGKAALLAMCALLVATAGSAVRRLRLGLLLAFLFFQLEHYESFLWSGSSIDHFQVLLFAAAAMVALARGTWNGVIAGGVFGFLATFTLAHGLAVWPAGALLLGLARRKRHLAVWCGLGLLTAGAFAAGFELNRAEAFATPSPGGVLKIIAYWLSLLGAVPALGHANLAPYCGGALLVLLIVVISRPVIRRDAVAVALVFFAVMAAGLIALGRAELSGGQIYSRYYVISSLAWALGLFLLLERYTSPRRPLRILALLLPALAVFNVYANREFTDETESWLSCRDIAAVSYKQYGADGRGIFRLYPNPERSTMLLREAEAQGLYRLGPVCVPAEFPADAVESSQINYFIEEISANATAVSIRGWAGIPGRVTGRNSIYLVLRSSQDMRLYTTVTVPRADVPAAHHQPGWANSGFHFARLLARMPGEDFQIGLLITDGRKAEYIMTGHQLKLASGLTAAPVVGQ